MLDLYLKDKKTPSAYNPKKEVRELLVDVKKCFEHGYNLQHKPFRFFNDMSVLERQNTSQKVFNLYEDPEPKDPDLKWRERSRRPLSRNKTINIAAHLISSMMYPNVFAQDDQDEEDKDAAEMMRTMILYNIDNSDYEMSMLFGVVAACVNPCMYMSVDYVEAIQEIKEEYENGDIGVQEVVDEVLSGFQIEPIPIDEVLISNIWQYDHQKQSHIIRRKLIDYHEAEAIYKHHDDWKHVQIGVQTVWDNESFKFYRSEESIEERDMLVEQVIYRCRTKDLEVPFVNGIFLGDKTIENNLIQHRDNRNRPKYPEAKTGYEPYDEKRFYYYKSLVEKLWPDQKRFDKFHRLFADGSYLAALPPKGVIGVNRKLNRSILFPGSITQFPKDASIVSLDPGSNLAATYNQMLDAEKSATESSQDNIRGGISPTGGRTAYEISRIEYNAVIKEFAIFGRMIGSLVEKVGELMIDDIVRFQTVLEPEELFSESLRFKARQYLLPNESEKGKKVTKKIIFTDEYMGQKMNEQEKLEESFNVYAEEEAKGGLVRIMKANPEIVSKLQYKINVEPDSMTPRSQAFQEERKLSFRDKMLTSPVADIEAVERDFLFDVAAPGQADKYMKKAQELGISGEITSPLGKSAQPLNQNQNVLRQSIKV